MSPQGILKLLVEEEVTLTAGVPTIWQGLLPLLDGVELPKLRRIPCGGSAVPRALSEAFREKLGKPILQAWGMTETSPVATAAPPGPVRRVAGGGEGEALGEARSAANTHCQRLPACRRCSARCFRIRLSLS